MINKKMDQLANNLAELEGVPEAETLAKLLLEPSKGMGKYIQIPENLRVQDVLVQIQAVDSGL